MKKKDLPKVEPVHIKDRFGMKAGKWLTIMYALIFVLLVFLIGFLPGIINGSKRVSFSSAAYNSAVYIDGNYAGGTPFTTTVKSGDHEVEFKVNGHTIDSFSVKVSHPVFLTWLIPRHQSVISTATLTEDAFKSVNAEFLTDAATYSAIKNYSSVYNYPPIFKNYAKTVLLSEESFSSRIEEVMSTACLFITTEEMKTDAEEACELLSLNLDTSIKDASVSEKANRENIKAPTSVKNAVLSDSVSGYSMDEDFCISRNEITEELFVQFTQEVPYWSKSNLSQLVSDGVADSFYLAETNVSSPSSSRPVRNISYYGALAFCEWLSSKTGRTVTLPTETQWMKASLVSDQNYQRTLVSASTEDKPVSMFGGLWEMTSSSYIPGSRYSDLADKVFVENGGVSEVAVKGGSYVNTASSIDSYTTGTTALSTCSDYMGFRVVWNY